MNPVPTQVRSPSFRISPTLTRLVIVFAWAIALHGIPQFLTGIPLRDQLEQDPQCFVNFWQQLLHPEIFAADETMPRLLPAGETLCLHLFALLGRALHFDMYSWSVVLSFVSLMLYLAGVYAVVLYHFRNRSHAFWIAMLSAVPIRMLGASRLGFQALGFVPQDLALAVSFFLLLLYLRAVKTHSKKSAAFFFFLCGILCNFYPHLFVQMAATFLLTEIFRARKFQSALLFYAFCFAAGAAPAIVEILSRFGLSQPIDLPILRLRYQFMLILPLAPRALYYLRTFIVFALADAAILFWVFRAADKGERGPLHPWVSMASASFVLSIAGLVLESTTPFTRLLLSRASLWFGFSSLMMIFYGFLFAFRKRSAAGRSGAAIPMACFAIFFLLQSNLLTMAVKFYRAYQSREDRKNFLAAVRRLEEISRPEDLVVAPAGRQNDLAIEVRTYSKRPVYVAYKDGGVALIDGRLARQWWSRVQAVEAIFQDARGDTLLEWMAREGIRYAFIPESYARGNPDLESHVVFQQGNYRILKS